MKMRLIKPNYLKAIVTLFGIAIIPAFRLTTLPSVIEAKVIAEESELKHYWDMTLKSAQDYNFYKKKYEDKAATIPWIRPAAIP